MAEQGREGQCNIMECGKRKTIEILAMLDTLPLLLVLQGIPHRRSKYSRTRHFISANIEVISRTLS